MDVIENLLSGTLNMQDFLEQLKHDPELQQFIRGLIPEEAIQDSNHAFWKIFPYASLRQNHFDFMHFLFWALQSRGTIGNHLTIFSRLRKAYLYHHPDVPCTRKYEDAFDVYLDVVTDCFDGPEVREITERIV